MYGPFGGNFVKTMLRLADDRDEVSVVSDQLGCPTSSLDLAEAILRLIGSWEWQGPVGGMPIYHAAGTGSTSWAGLARAVFAARAARTGTVTQVRDISTRDYPTKAARPANSVLDCGKLADALGWTMPRWDASVASQVARLLMV